MWQHARIGNNYFLWQLVQRYTPHDIHQYDQHTNHDHLFAYRGSTIYTQCTHFIVLINVNLFNSLGLN